MTTDTRRLGKIESAVALSAERWPMNLVAILRFAGSVDASLLQRSFDHLRHRHPALRARIERRGRSRHFVYDVPASPVSTGDRENDGSWVAVTESALNNPVDPAGGLVALSLLSREATGPSEVVLVFHHSIVDGASATNLIDELLSTYEALAAGNPAPAYPGLAVPPPADELFPAGYSGPRMTARQMAFVLGNLGSEARFRAAMRRLGGPPVRPESRTQIAQVTLDAATTEALERTARSRRLTLNSVIQAAALLSVNRHRYSSEALAMRSMTFADLRPHFADPVGPAPLACYMAMTWQDVRIADTDDLWTAAGKVQSGVDRAVRGGARFVACSMSLPFMKMALASTKQRVGNTALTFTGNAGLSLNYGPLRLTGLHAFVSNLGLGPELSMRAGLFDGQLTLDAMTLDADMPRADMVEMMDTVVDQLNTG